jgi:uncharacterized membrane protein (UPF0127 family)
MAADASGTAVSITLTYTQGFLQRLCGVFGCPALHPGQGLVLSPCRCVHTFFLRRPLDLVFFDAAGRCVRVVNNAAPWGVWRCSQAVGVVELPGGFLRDVPQALDTLQRMLCARARARGRAQCQP